MWRKVTDFVFRIPGVRRAYLGIASRWRRCSVVEYKFTRIFERNGWRGAESVSGRGSGLDQTRRLRVELPILFEKLHVATLLDLPCGDFHWMRAVDLGKIQYLGGDIVKELVARNQQYESAGVRFRHLDLLSDDLPQVDLILCRDCLVHLSFAHAFQALQNMWRSGSTYLLTTTFPHKTENQDIETGTWRPLNLEASPFRFPQPMQILSEGYDEGTAYADKSLALWRLADIVRCAGRQTTPLT